MFFEMSHCIHGKLGSLKRIFPGFLFKLHVYDKSKRHSCLWLACALHYLPLNFPVRSSRLGLFCLFRKGVAYCTCKVERFPCNFVLPINCVLLFPLLISACVIMWCGIFKKYCIQFLVCLEAVSTKFLVNFPLYGKNLTFVKYMYMLELVNCIFFVFAHLLSLSITCEGKKNCKAVHPLWPAANFFFVSYWVYLSVGSPLSGYLILRDGAISHNWPQIASNRTIWGKSHNS